MHFKFWILFFQVNIIIYFQGHMRSKNTFIQYNRINLSTIKKIKVLLSWVIKVFIVFSINLIFNFPYFPFVCVFTDSNFTFSIFFLNSILIDDVVLRFDNHFTRVDLSWPFWFSYYYLFREGLHLSEWPRRR